MDDADLKQFDDAELLRLVYDENQTDKVRVAAKNTLIELYDEFLLELATDIFRHHLRGRIDDWDAKEAIDNVWAAMEISQAYPQVEARPNLERTTVCTWLIGLLCQEIDRRLHR